MRIFRFLVYSLSAILGVVLLCGPSPARAQSAAPAAKSGDTPAGNADTGKKLFVKYGCYECHGREAQGSVMTGPRLGPNPIPFEVLQAYVRKPTREMPPYTDKVVSDKDLADIYAFLQSRPHPPAVSPLLK